MFTIERHYGTGKSPHLQSIRRAPVSSTLQALGFMPYAAARRRLSASAIGTLPVSQSRISPVVGDCVVELVGLEPTTKVLWNMVGVRPG